MFMDKFTIEDVVETNKRFAGYHGMEISFVNGVFGEDLDLDTAEKLSIIITEIMNKKKAKKFLFYKGKSE